MAPAAHVMHALERPRGKRIHEIQGRGEPSQTRYLENSQRQPDSGFDAIEGI
jgi:hypothetical protein